MTVQNDNFMAADAAPINLFSGKATSFRKGGLYRNYGKRLLDITLVLIAAPIVLPVLIVLAAFAASDGCNPFYSQRRVGRNGRIFTMWKIRTMVPDAEARLERHLENDMSARQEWDEKQKLSVDPRVTTLGAFIRKTSLDELPQLWNVLIGDMSLVGPRPMMPKQRSLYPGLSYFYMRPGVSGFWQITDRNNSTFAARAEFDDMYNESIGLKTDIRVLFSTVSVVLRGTGC